MNIQEVLDTPLLAGQSVLARLDRTGDTKVMWDRNDRISVGIAREAYNKGKQDGLVGYKVEGTDGKKGEVLAQFDPSAERIILAPPMRGGAA